jgi:hypothetical protein
LKQIARNSSYQKFPKEITMFWQLRSNIKHFCFKDRENEKFIPLSENAISINAINSFQIGSFYRKPKQGQTIYISIFSAAGKKHEG